MTGTQSITIIGAGGRMGASLEYLVDLSDDFELVGRVDRKGHSHLGQIVRGVELTSNLTAALEKSDVAIDFSAPGSTFYHAEQCVKAKCAYVVGTTGLSLEDQAALDAAARDIVVVQAGNFSTGVAVLAAAVKLVASKLDAGDWDVEITDRHHRYKIDSPSGTAVMLGEAAAGGRGVTLKDKAVTSRGGIHGERQTGDIGFSAVRGGAIIGEHDVAFLSGSERVTLSHVAENRNLFAEGALKAARYAVKQSSAGRYTIADVLGL